MRTARPSARDTAAALGQTARLVADGASRESLLKGLTSADRPVLVAFVNAHGCNLAVKDVQLAHALMGADVLLRDGIGMALLCRRLGLDPGINMNGTDFIPELLDRYADRRVALFGTRDPWLTSAAAQVGKGAQVVVTRDGFANDEAYLDDLRSHPAELVVLAMGMPRQEELGVRLRDELEYPCVIVCGGAVLDFLAGRVVRAPQWMRSARVEWVWRLVHEPRRLFGRYVLGNLVFVARMIRIGRSTSVPPHSS